MTYLILSDIHGNREALEAVLDHARGQYNQVLCLGDLVGYGADPNFAAEWARTHVAAIVRGNHDRAAIEDDSLESYQALARDAMRWTRQALSRDNRDYLLRMPCGPLAYDGFNFMHGSPVDEDQYLVSVEDVTPLVPSLETPLTFFGHTHVQGGFLVASHGVKNIDPACALEVQPDHCFNLVNPGSVGQPRDGDWRAAYALYSPEDQVVEFARVPYNAGATAEKIVLAGLSATLAARLLLGR